MVKALANADRELTMDATKATLFPANSENILANIINSGAPGGCPTSSLYEVAINSPQSHSEAVGSLVIRYTVAAMANTNQPEMLLYLLKFFT